MNMHVDILGTGPKTLDRLRERIECLEEENRQLRDRIGHLTGQYEKHREAAIAKFRLSPAEAVFFLMLVHRGAATHEQLRASLFSDEQYERISRIDEAVRSHAKRLRRKIRPQGLDFTTVYGFGFQFDEETRRLAKHRLEAA